METVVHSRKGQRLQELKNRLTLEVFLQRGDFWQEVRVIRSRWRVNVATQLPPEPAENGAYPDFYERVPAFWDDREGDLTEQWLSDIANLHYRVIPPEYHVNGNDPPLAWGSFLENCVLYNPPADALLEFAQLGGPGPMSLRDMAPSGPCGGTAVPVPPMLPPVSEDQSSRLAMIVAPIVFLRDAELAADVEREFREGLLGEVAKRLGMTVEDLLDDIRKDRPEIFDRYGRGIQENEQRCYIRIDTETVGEDVDAAVRLITAEQRDRPRRGRPPLDDLQAVQAAIWKKAGRSNSEINERLNLRSAHGNYANRPRFYQLRNYLRRGQEILETAYSPE